ncbi:Short-chain-enoyl-CoA hydratase [Clostridium haemolyticum]|uniref:short-chain-enoyl-CoA hydratase n=1 Tax=Clostridium haemolyticum TaxID=84025 RepID=UPI001C3992CF|nr:short-chain-enoyl-CoA hydratase [Clostridium haemolyticum]CAG7839341.1 Short-chain-enoyl-CoA hydratase [Clostridium haemolyticum]
MEHKNVLLEKENNIAIVTINRPEALNALNTNTLNELDLVVDEVAKDDNILVVILTGAGEKAFVAGADISEMKDKNVMEGRKFGLLGNKIFRKVETLEKPVIAAVNGFALGGGCELSMACDIRIASQKAKFGQPEVSLGITPGFGGTQRLARHIGVGMAKELIYSAKNINADEAFRIGLVNKVVAPEELMKEAKKLANEIAGRSPIAVKLCKQAINRGIQVDIDTAINIEAEIFGECFSTEDQKDAMTAFVEKRKLDGFKNR